MIKNKIKSKQIPTRELKKRSVAKKYLKSTKTIAAVFPRGSKKRKSNNDHKHEHGQEKRRPTTLS